MVNKDNRLLVEEDLMEISELREAAVAFLDNGGGTEKRPVTIVRVKETQVLLITLKKQLSH